MKLLRIPAILISIAVLGCSSTAPAAVGPTTQPTDVASMPTATPSAFVVVPTLASTSKPTPAPTSEPTPVPTSAVAQMPRGNVDPAIKVTVYNREKVWPGTTLLNDNHDAEWPRIIEVNMLGEVVWEYVIPRDIWEDEPLQNMAKDVELLASGNVLFGLPGRGIFEINRSGEIVWSHLDEKMSHVA